MPDLVPASITQPGVWLATTELTSLIPSLRTSVSETPFVFLESASRAILAPLTDFLSDPPRVTPDRWRGGRAFGTTYEIRWHMIDARRATLTLLTEIGEADDLPLRELSWRPSDWKDRLDNKVMPRLMSVIAPFDGQLRGLDYFDRLSGAVAMTRLCEWRR